MTLASTIAVALHKMLGSEVLQNADDDSFVAIEEIEKIGDTSFPDIRIDSSESLEN